LHELAPLHVVKEKGLIALLAVDVRDHNWPAEIKSEEVVAKLRFRRAVLIVVLAFSATGLLSGGSPLDAPGTSSINL
jgi:hypothetical protein